MRRRRQQEDGGRRRRRQQVDGDSRWPGDQPWPQARDDFSMARLIVPNLTPRRGKQTWDQSWPRLRGSSRGARGRI